MRRVVLIGCALACAGFTVVRDSDSLEPIRWPSNSITIVVHDGMTSAENTAAQNSLAVWSAVGCSGFNLVYGGTSGTAGDAEDGSNRISFLTSGWPGGSGVVGLTTRYRTAGAPDIWREADIILNADPGQSTWTWATDGRVGAYDVQTTVTHELGHVVGLMHTPSPEATMYFGGRRARTMWRTLHADDVAGICYLYPSGTFSCTTDDECPLFDNFYGGDHEGTECNAGSCVVGGSAVYGQACFDDNDCATGPCLQGLDAAPGIDPGYCTQACGSCPGADLCDDIAGPSYCMLGYDDCVVDADCASGSFCPMDLDGRFRCLRLCDETHPCPANGTVCHHNDDGFAGFCRFPGPGADGSNCDDGYDCASLICAGLTEQPRCHGGSISPSDGAPPPDGAPPGDPVSPSDPGDTAVSADGTVIPTDGGSPPGGDADATVTGGCACSQKGDSYLFLFLVLWPLRRRIRRLFLSSG